MESSLDAPTENAVGRQRLIAVLVMIVLVFLAVAGVIAGTVYSENKRRRACQSRELQLHELSTLERQPSPHEVEVPATGSSTTTTPSLTSLTRSTSTQLSILFEPGPTAFLATSPIQNHVPTLVDEVNDPLAHVGTSVVPPTLAHTRSTSTQQPANAVEGFTVFGSIQQRGLQRSHRPTRLELPDDPLPPYEEPPSYHTEDGFSGPGERV